MKVLQLCPADCSRSGIADYARRMRDGLRSRGSEVIPLPVPNGSQFRSHDIARYVEDARTHLRRGVDVVQAELGGDSVHEFHAASALAMQSTTPVCLTLHDPPRPVWSPFELALARSRPWLRACARRAGGRRARALELRLLEAASAVFVLAPSGREAVRRRFPMLEGSRMFVLPYPTPSRTPVEQPRKGNGELVAGFFGHWYGGKDLELLVTAVADLASESPPTRLRLWGTPLNELSQRYERRVRRRLRDLGHPDAVELAGWLEDSRIEAELGSCDVVVLPYEQPSSRAELASVSGVLFDAFSLGIPVVATDVRALADSLHHEVNGLLVPAGNRQALTGALRRLRDDSELREHLALGARETGAQSNLESAVSTLERHYERLLGVSSRDPVVAA